MNENAYQVLTAALQCIKASKPYTLAGFEPGIFCSGCVRNDHYALHCSQGKFRIEVVVTRKKVLWSKWVANTVKNV
jgi:hypothetical protein